MKFFFVFIVMAGISCCKSEKTTQNTVQDRVATFLKAHGQMAPGDQFVSITELDTVTVKDYVDREMEVLSLSLINKEQRLKRLDSLENVFKKSLDQHPNPKDQITITNLNDVIRSRTAIFTAQHKMDSLTAMVTPEMSHTFKFIGFNYSFTSTTSSGAKMPRLFYVKLDQDLNVLSATDLKN